MQEKKKDSFLFKVLIGKHEFSDDEYILKYKIITLSSIINILIIAVSMMGVIHYVDGDTSQANIDFVLVASFMIAGITLRYSKKSFTIISRLFLLLALSVASLQLFWYPESASGVIWFSTMVYVGFFLLDRREGWVWVITILIGLCSIYILDPNFIALSPIEFVTFILNLILISFLLNWYEKIKEESYILHEKHRLELEETILLKTQELQKLNANLHNRVDMEMDKNRDKEKQMIHQSRLAQMGEMISMIAHQWRQPLAAISATASALQLKIARKRYDEEIFLNSVKQINEYSQHLSSTIDDFRNFFSANKEKSLFKLKDCVEGSLSIIGSSLSNKNIQVTTEVIYDEEIFSYPNEIRQVILNILKNAEDILMEKKIENPKIHIKINHLGPMQILEIGDNAGGIPAEIKDKIFDPYFTTKEKRDGTGLGLYMSKTIIEDHCGGKISVYNSAQGAVFEISFRKKAMEDSI
jgi:signal transduction histidine kinase